MYGYRNNQARMYAETIVATFLPVNFFTFVHYDEGMDVIISHNPTLLQIQRILEEHSNASERRNIKKYFIDGLFNIWNTEGISILEIRRKIQTIFDE